MKVEELRDLLNVVAKDGMGECEVVIGARPWSPLRLRFDGVATPLDVAEAGWDPDAAEGDERPADPRQGELYLVAGDGCPDEGSRHAPGCLWDVVRSC